MSNEEQRWELMKPEAEHIKELMLKAEEDLVNMRAQEHMYQLEYTNPVHIGKPEALEKIAIYQKRIRNIEQNLFAYKMFAHNKGIEL